MLLTLTVDDILLIEEKKELEVLNSIETLY